MEGMSTWKLHLCVKRLRAYLKLWFALESAHRPPGGEDGLHHQLSKFLPLLLFKHHGPMLKIMFHCNLGQSIYTVRFPHGSWQGFFEISLKTFGSLQGTDITKSVVHFHNFHSF
ncbi:hypothetical protein AVEN_186158-1 [Araneus ventricosus]|uniref:Uncharacterized protein n=1 Tax=Araneus ventricosus TaxID=182803 RepID=A0A4Y2GE38_ARAVE|nr:hypothetical protein AVEN_186158-1 [Araneus ventricosus]